MPQPKPKFLPIVDRLNDLRNEGSLCDPSDLGMIRLKREIESLSNSDNKHHRLTLSAYYGLTGNWAEMRRHGEAVVRGYRDDETRIFYATTLLNTGFITDAASVLSEVDWDSLEFPERKLTLGAGVFQYTKIINYTELCSRAGIQGFKKMEIIRAAKKILDECNIPDSVIAAMMDLAGELLREQNLLRTVECTVLPYPADKTITILQPVNLPANQIAQLDWEYALRLFERMPDAPTTVVHVGFSAAYIQ